MVSVFRYGHRPWRDIRVSTHTALLSRAYCVKEFFYSGIEDKDFEKNIANVCKEWGGSLKISFVEDYLSFLKKAKEKYTLVHLTMYGKNINSFDFSLLKNKNLLVFIGAEKVPFEVYKLSDYNIAVGKQPHSEIAALAVFLDRLNPEALDKEYKDAKRKAGFKP